MEQAIRIETLDDLVAHSYGLNAMCDRCRHRADGSRTDTTLLREDGAYGVETMIEGPCFQR
jgi:hypothetical protein